MTLKIPKLKTFKRFARFQYHGVVDEDIFADAGVINDKMVGTLFSVSDDIERLLRDPENLDPVDRDRVDVFLERIVENDYIIALADMLTKEMGADLETWQQGYTYHWSEKDNKHYRAGVVLPQRGPDNKFSKQDQRMLDSICARLNRYIDSGGYEEYVIWPAGGPESYRRIA